MRNRVVPGDGVAGVTYHPGISITIIAPNAEDPGDPMEDMA